MSSHSLSGQTLTWARLSILLSVVLTILVTALMLSRSYPDQMYPQLVPLADINVWHALGQ
ncbi:MAG: hypothetical protein AAGH78_11650 [Cyanobacteria bacterium P01_H01_bin.58]